VAGEGVPGSAVALRRVADALRKACGCEAWLAFDSLMSVTRQGALGDPEPLSLAFVADRPGRVAAMQQTFRVVRGLRRAGVAAEVSGDGRCTATVEVDGKLRVVALQACWRVDDRVVFAPGLPARAGVDAVLPLAELDLDGTELPVPAEPDRVLTAMYGEEWRTLQPPYTLRPRAARAAADPNRGYARNRRHWDRLYRGLYGVAVPAEPSSFGRWVVGREQRHNPRPLVVDVGCGNGRDTRLFADRGHDVLGLDYSPAALECAQGLLGPPADGGELRVVDLNDLRATLVLGAELAAADTPVVVYARYVANAVDDDGRDNLWRMAAMALRRGGHMYLEFCTTRDESLARGLEDQQYRRFLDPREVSGELERHGAAVVHQEEGRGLSPYRFGDPYVCRLVVQWAS
jgi:SAM-dependent methyltransferase